MALVPLSIATQFELNLKRPRISLSGLCPLKLVLRLTIRLTSWKNLTFTTQKTNHKSQPYMVAASLNGTLTDATSMMICRHTS